MKDRGKGGEKGKKTKERDNKSKEGRGKEPDEKDNMMKQ